MVVLLLLVAAWPAAHGHGGMVWPPIWQDGNYLPLDEVQTNNIESNPPVRDPKTNKEIDNTKSWSTDQAYTGGHGVREYQGKGPHTNVDRCATNGPGLEGHCGRSKHPWAAPGLAPELGEGCGIHGGNPFGCPAHNDTRPPGSQCPDPDHDAGTWSYGSRALDIDFPQAATTRWTLGDTVPVGFIAIYHGGGYTYRLCKLPAEGKAGLTEDCFARNILEFAEDKTYYRDTSHGDWNGETEVWKWIDNSDQEWRTEPKVDLTSGTHPAGSAWRYMDPFDWSGSTEERIFKDLVKVPEELVPGQYVLSWRWDAASGAQVWVSCANIEIVPRIGR